MYIHTSLIRSLPISQIVGTNVWLKLDAIQPSGSFKLRGMGHKAQIEKQNGAKKFISSSGGNAGLAVAYAGMELEVTVAVYVPRSTQQSTIEKLKLFQAEVIVTGDHWAETHQQAVKELEEEGAVYFHPFDDELVWDGHASLIDEVVADGLKPDLVICSVGGGGLLCGLMQGLERNHLSSTRLLGVETIGADSLNQSKNRGEHIQLPAITSKASSLGAVKVCEQAYSLLSDSRVFCDVVSDEEAANACESFLRDHRIKVELACGASLAVAYENRIKIQENMKNILIVICGGVND